MSFIRAKAIQPEIAEKLEARLLEEMVTPSDDPLVEPIIHAAPAAPEAIGRLVVIWDAWPNLSLRERSDIILAAYKRAFGEQAASAVYLALGLTFFESNASRPPWEQAARLGASCASATKHDGWRR